MYVLVLQEVQGVNGGGVGSDGFLSEYATAIDGMEANAVDAAFERLLEDMNLKANTTFFCSEVYRFAEDS